MSAKARAIVLHIPRPLAWSAIGADAPDWFRRQWEAEVENRRLFLGLPVAFGLGVLLYFAADREPGLWAPFGGALAFAIAAYIARANFVAFIICTGLAAVFAGFAAGVLRTREVAAPMLARPMIGPLVGMVESIEERPGGSGRLVVRVSSLAKLSSTETPARVRVTVRSITGLKPGDTVEGVVRLLPPPEPARPGGYDFAREAFFKGIGAVGSFSGTPKLRAPVAPPSWDIKLAASMDEARNALTKRIADTIGGQAGAVAAALVTGKRGLITEETNDALRAAGIYHIVSISGLHMVLAAGGIFWLVRAFLSLFPGLALTLPIKKWAALAGMVGATAYCVFSGSEVATERSLIMTLVMLGAILVDRPALTLHNLAIAALIVMVREPETVLGPSFQMSFAAVAALIAFCNLQPPKTSGPAPGLIMRLVRAGTRASVLMFWTTLVATLATSPFGAFHFQTMSPYGLIGNALALPFVSIIVMPAAMLGVFLYPFGLDAIAWSAMGLATDKVLLISGMMAGWQSAIQVVPAFGPLALGLMALGLVILTLSSTPLRWFGLMPAVLGVALAASPDRPDLLIDRDISGLAVRGSDGHLMLLGDVPDFTAEQWLKADGDNRSSDDASLQVNVRCDPLGCTAPTADGRIIAFVKDARALYEDCRKADILVTRLKAPQPCAAAIILDRQHLKASGAMEVRLTQSGPVLRAVRGERGARPWINARINDRPSGEGRVKE